MKKIFLLFLLLSVSLQGCKDRCESKMVGSVGLLDNSLSYLPYTEGDTLVFESKEGDQLSFIADTVHENGRICVDYLCQLTADPFQQVPCEYYEAEGRRNILRSTNEELVIDIVLSVENYEEESTLFYDLFSIHFSGIGSLASGSHIVEAQFSDPELDSEKVFFDPFLEEVSSIQIEGQTFSNVLKTAAGDNEIIYKSGTGILVLKYLGVNYFSK